nr:protein RRNAD1 [Ipomoea batatas]
MKLHSAKFTASEIPSYDDYPDLHPAPPTPFVVDYGETVDKEVDGLFKRNEPVGKNLSQILPALVQLGTPLGPSLHLNELSLLLSISFNSATDLLGGIPKDCTWPLSVPFLLKHESRNMHKVGGSTWLTWIGQMPEMLKSRPIVDVGSVRCGIDQEDSRVVCPKTSHMPSTFPETLKAWSNGSTGKIWLFVVFMSSNPPNGLLRFADSLADTIQKYLVNKSCNRAKGKHYAANIIKGTLESNLQLSRLPKKSSGSSSQKRATAETRCSCLAWAVGNDGKKAKSTSPI